MSNNDKDMTWEMYCEKKKINSALFREKDPEQWAYLKNYFEQIHPESFTQQKKFLINELRRRYSL